MGSSGGEDREEYRREADESWLLERVEMRKRANFSPWTIFPRSPSPQRKEMQGVEPAEKPPELTQEELERNAKFQKGLKTAIKGEAKEAKKAEKKAGKKDKGKADDGNLGEKQEGGKKDKKEKKEKKKAAESSSDSSDNEKD